MKSHLWKAALAMLAVGWLVASRASACPFCNAEQPTLSEDLRGADASVLAKLVKEAPAPANANDPNSGTATFRVFEVIRGREQIQAGKEIEVVFFGDSNREKIYLVNGLGKDKLDWTTPLPLSAPAVKYVKQLPHVATTGADRLAFFQDYLENDDPLLAQDAYDEFAKAPYAELRDLGPRMKHDRVVKWITDPETSPNRRRLYLTMLGICGNKGDVPMLESMIASDFEAFKPALELQVQTAQQMGGPIGLGIWVDAVQQEERRKKLGLDALVACYLILRGPDGLDLVEKRFLKNPHAEYTHVYSTIMALRFHGDENTHVIPRERLLTSMRLLLDNADFADQVILDLSRWEDWSVLDRLVEMFKTSDPKSYIRQPVVSYLTVAGDQKGDVGTRAKTALAELEKLDPETVKQAKSLIMFGALGRARGMASAGKGASAKPQAVGSAALAATAANDATGGFAASAADDKSDPKQIPDPTTYEQKEPAAKAPKAEVAAKGPAAETASPVNRSATVNSSRRLPQVLVAKLNPIVVAGVPLVAAGLLMVVYWYILRAGTV
jgi:hypothetical protein